jgi:hypothetical protein
MTLRKTLAISAAFFFVASTVFAGAGHDHAPKHGGIVVEAKEVDFEFVLKPELIQMYVRGHKPVKLEGATAKLTLLAGTNKTEVPLSLAGDKFEAKGKFDVATGTKGVAILTLAGQSPRTARFQVK